MSSCDGGGLFEKGSGPADLEGNVLYSLLKRPSMDPTKTEVFLQPSFF